MKIVHVITGLDTGGAEMMLYKLLSAMDRARFENSVIALTDGHAVGDKIAALGIPVMYLGMAPGKPSLCGFIKLLGELRTRRPDLVQTWMYHGDLLGGLAAKLAGVKHVVWNIRHSDLPGQHCKLSTRLVAKACALLSHALPDKIICNSQRAVAIHAQLGYKQGLLQVIGNGFDLQRFHPDAGAKAAIRRELGIGPGASLVGLVARFDVQKNHRGFIAAAQQVAQALPNVQFILAGRGVDASNPELRGWFAASGCAEQFHLLGERDDIPQLTAAFDVAVSCSIFGEGFPNSVGEAMACAVPCAVSDVGDAAWVVADAGLVVPPGDTPALAAALLGLLQLPAGERMALGRLARQRVEGNFSLPVVVGQYQDLYVGLHG